MDDKKLSKSDDVSKTPNVALPSQSKKKNKASNVVETSKLRSSTSAVVTMDHWDLLEEKMKADSKSPLVVSAAQSSSRKVENVKAATTKPSLADVLPKKQNKAPQTDAESKAVIKSRPKTEEFKTKKPDSKPTSTKTSTTQKTGTTGVPCGDVSKQSLSLPSATQNPSSAPLKVDDIESVLTKLYQTKRCDASTIAAVAQIQRASPQKVTPSLELGHSQKLASGQATSSSSLFDMLKLFNKPQPVVPDSLLLSGLSSTPMSTPTVDRHLSVLDMIKKLQPTTVATPQQSLSSLITPVAAAESKNASSNTILDPKLQFECSDALLNYLLQSELEKPYPDPINVILMKNLKRTRDEKREADRKLIAIMSLLSSGVAATPANVFAAPQQMEPKLLPVASPLLTATSVVPSQTQGNVQQIFAMLSKMQSAAVGKSDDISNAQQTASVGSNERLTVQQMLQKLQRGATTTPPIADKAASADKVVIKPNSAKANEKLEKVNPSGNSTTDRSSRTGDSDKSGRSGDKMKNRDQDDERKRKRSTECQKEEDDANRKRQKSMEILKDQIAVPHCYNCNQNGHVFNDCPSLGQLHVTISGIPTDSKQCSDNSATTGTLFSNSLQSADSSAQYFGCEICSIHGMPYSTNDLQQHMNSNSHKIMKIFFDTGIWPGPDEKVAKGRLKEPKIFSFKDRKGTIFCSLCQNTLHDGIAFLQHQQSDYHWQKLILHKLDNKLPVIFICGVCDGTVFLSRLAYEQHCSSTPHAERERICNEKQVAKPADHSQHAEDKSRLCRHWMSKGICKFGDSCQFLHPPQPNVSAKATNMPTVNREKWQSVDKTSESKSYSVAIEDCTLFYTGQCPQVKKIGCPYHHRHVAFYDQLCDSWKTSRTCPFGDGCPFRHSTFEFKNSALSSFSSVTDATTELFKANQMANIKSKNVADDKILSKLEEVSKNSNVSVLSQSKETTTPGGVNEKVKKCPTVKTIHWSLREEEMKAKSNSDSVTKVNSWESKTSRNWNHKGETPASNSDSTKNVVSSSKPESTSSRHRSSKDHWSLKEERLKTGSNSDSAKKVDSNSKAWRPPNLKDHWSLKEEKMKAESSHSPDDRSSKNSKSTTKSNVAERKSEVKPDSKLEGSKDKASQSAKSKSTASSTKEKSRTEPACHDTFKKNQLPPSSAEQKPSLKVDDIESLLAKLHQSKQRDASAVARMQHTSPQVLTSSLEFGQHRQHHASSESISSLPLSNLLKLFKPEPIVPEMHSLLSQIISHANVPTPNTGSPLSVIDIIKNLKPITVAAAPQQSVPFPSLTASAKSKCASNMILESNIQSECSDVLLDYLLQTELSKPNPDPINVILMKNLKQTRDDKREADKKLKTMMSLLNSSGVVSPASLPPAAVQQMQRKLLPVASPSTASTIVSPQQQQLQSQQNLKQMMAALNKMQSKAVAKSASAQTATSVGSNETVLQQMLQKLQPLAVATATPTPSIPVKTAVADDKVVIKPKSAKVDTENVVAAKPSGSKKDSAKCDVRKSDCSDGRATDKDRCSRDTSKSRAADKERRSRDTSRSHDEESRRKRKRSAERRLEETKRSRKHQNPTGTLKDIISVPHCYKCGHDGHIINDCPLLEQLQVTTTGVRNDNPQCSDASAAYSPSAFTPSDMNVSVDQSVSVYYDATNPGQVSGGNPPFQGDTIFGSVPPEVTKLSAFDRLGYFSKVGKQVLEERQKQKEHLLALAETLKITVPNDLRF